MKRETPTRDTVQRGLLSRHPWLRLLKPPSPTLNTGRLLKKLLADFPPANHLVLDLGCGPRNIDGTIRCDLELEPPGIRADAARLPLASQSFDCVIATALLEHVPHPRRVVREIRRVLRPGGLVYIEIPFLEGFHADPDDYQRLTFRGLDVLLRDFDIVDREVCVGPSSALSWILREYIASWFASPRLSLAAKYVAAWLTLPIKYIDHLAARRPGAYRIAAGLAVVARRPIR
jgi:SAM-dependent methyltransferase